MMEFSQYQTVDKLLLYLIFSSPRQGCNVSLTKLVFLDFPIEQYGYDTTHSGLVLFPVDYDAEHETASIIDAKKLQSLFHFIGVTVSPLDAYKQIYEPGVDTFEYALLSASFGYVSIAPKTTGYGEASSLVPYIIDKKNIFTATMPLYWR